MTMEALGVMDIIETRNSALRGAAVAAALRKAERPGETFRFPHALLMLAIGNRRAGLVGSLQLAIRAALEWSTNPQLTEADAETFIRKLVRQHKAEIIAYKTGA
jgi:hypothetical protein